MHVLFAFYLIVDHYFLLTKATLKSNKDELQQ